MSPRSDGVLVLTVLAVAAVLSLPGPGYAVSAGPAVAGGDGAVVGRENGFHGSVSPDGTSVVYVVAEAGSPGGRSSSSLWLRSLSGHGRPRRLTDGRGDDDFPVFSPDGATVFFHSNRGGLTKIWSMPVGGGTPRQVTFGASQDFHPAVSPTGRYLAYDSNRSGNYDVWVRDLRSGEDVQLTDGGAPDFSPTWSPQEKALAYTSSREGGFQIWVQRWDRRDERPVRVTSGPGVNAHPRWSPSGQFLAYDSDENGTVKAWVVELRRPFRTLRVTGDPWSEESPSWYPTGDRLLFTAVNPDGRRLGSAALPPMVPGAGEAAAASPVSPSAPLGAAAAPLPAADDDLLSLASAAPPLPAPPTRPESPPARPGKASDGLIRAFGETLAAAPERRASRGERVPGAAPAAETGPSLKVLQFFPKMNPEGVEPPRSLTVVFDRRLSSVADIDRALMVVDDQGETTRLVCSYNPNLRRIDAMPESPLARGRTFTVRVADAISGEGGEPLRGGFSWDFRTIADEDVVVARVEPVVDQRLMIVGTEPSEETARPDARVVCRFSVALDPETVKADSIMLFDGRGAKVAGEVLFPEGNSSLQLTPYERLSPGETYRVFISQKIRSASGKGLDGNHVWSFAVAHATPVVLADYEPKGFLGPQGDITLHFSRPVDPATMATGKVFLRDKSETYSGNTILGADGTSLLFAPHRRLPNKTELTLVLPPGLADTQGNGIEIPKPLVFTTRYEEKEAASDVGSILARHAGSLTGAVDAGQYLKNGSASDVPSGDWAHKAFVELARKGYVDRNLAGDLTRGVPLTRYKSALLVESAMKSAQLMNADETEVVQKLAQEFKAELRSLGVKLSGSFAPEANVLVGRG